MTLLDWLLLTAGFSVSFIVLRSAAALWSTFKTRAGESSVSPDLKRTYPSWIAGLGYPNPGEGRPRWQYAKSLKSGMLLRLVEEPENDVDDDAVAVYRGRQKLGYIPVRHDWIVRSLQEGDTLECRVASVQTATDSNSPIHVALEISVLKDG
jgi:hypothetical protein